MPHTPSNRSTRIAVVALGCLLLAGCGSGASGDQASELARRSELTMRSTGYSEVTLNDLRADPAAMQLAGELFAMNCAGCHGADGSAAKGITDLTRGRFAYGATEEAIRTTIRDGRSSAMPGMGREYGEVELGQIVAYLDTLVTPAPLNDYETRGQAFFVASCAACHGEDGRGLTALGAPDLTDDYWQHGDSMMNKRLIITRGAESACPSRQQSLTPAEIELLTAWVLQLVKS